MKAKVMYYSVQAFLNPLLLFILILIIQTACKENTQKPDIKAETKASFSWQLYSGQWVYSPLLTEAKSERRVSSKSGLGGIWEMDIRNDSSGYRVEVIDVLGQKREVVKREFKKDTAKLAIGGKTFSLFYLPNIAGLCLKDSVSGVALKFEKPEERNFIIDDTFPTYRAEVNYHLLSGNFITNSGKKVSFMVDGTISGWKYSAYEVCLRKSCLQTDSLTLIYLKAGDNIIPSLFRYEKGKYIFYTTDKKKLESFSLDKNFGLPAEEKEVTLLPGRKPRKL